MTVTVRQIRFPTRVKFGIVAGPSYMTQKVVTGSGHTFKNAQWEHPLRKLQLDTANFTRTHWDDLNAFVLAGAAGPLYNFRARDWSDYQAVAQIIGTGDGSTAEYQLTKTYTFGAYNYVRIITHPCGIIAGDTLPKIFIDAVEESASNYTVDYATGIITFTGGNEPAGGEVVTWTGEFDVPCELDDDYQPATYEDLELINGRSISISEVRV